MLRCFFFFSSRRRHTRLVSDWSSDVCSSDLDGFRLAVTSAWPLAGISSARSGVNLTSHPVGSDAENVTLRAGALPLFLTTSFSGELRPAVALPASRVSGVVTDGAGLAVTSARGP